jgi:hypothetical protein
VTDVIYIYASTLSRRNRWWGRKRRHPRAVAARLFLLTLCGLGGLLGIALVFRVPV